MDEWLDIAWIKIVDAMELIAALLNTILAPLNQRIGPAMVIFLLVAMIVAFTRLMAKIYNTRRYTELKKNYEHWYDLRQEAMACEDREKGKALARNIDQGQLNKAYYDYFFEGLLKSIITTILPICFLAAYINSAYAPYNLIQLVGRDAIFKISRSDGDPVVISAFFWFVICLLLVHLTWLGVRLIINRTIGRKKTVHDDSKLEEKPQEAPEN